MKRPGTTIVWDWYDDGQSHYTCTACDSGLTNASGFRVCPYCLVVVTRVITEEEIAPGRYARNKLRRDCLHGPDPFGRHWLFEVYYDHTKDLFADIREFDSCWVMYQALPVYGTYRDCRPRYIGDPPGPEFVSGAIAMKHQMKRVMEDLHRNRDRWPEYPGRVRVRIVDTAELEHLPQHHEYYGPFRRYDR
jgi:hypothetical protein